MRALLPVAPLVAALLLAPDLPEAKARPEFARREGKACGYCHINPRGGGSRNQRGLEYARNDFAFPPATGDLKSFGRERDRDAMVRVAKLIDIDHTRAAVDQLKKLLRAVKREDAARRLVEERLHELEVRGAEILGEARILLRGKDPDQGVELLVLLVNEYRDLSVSKDARDDLREVRRDPDHKERVKKEEHEARARLVYLDGLLERVDGDDAKTRKILEKVVADYPGTRAAKAAGDVLDPPKEEAE